MAMIIGGLGLCELVHESERTHRTDTRRFGQMRAPKSQTIVMILAAIAAGLIAFRNLLNAFLNAAAIFTPASAVYVTISLLVLEESYSKFGYDSGFLNGRLAV